MRAIVKDALKCDELIRQFEQIDAVTEEQVDKFYPDQYLINEALHWQDMANDNLGYWSPQDDDYKIWKKGLRQLKRFVAKWENKIQPHENDGLAWEELEKKMKEQS